MFYIFLFFRLKVDIDSLYIVYLIKIDLFFGEFNNIFQINIMFLVLKEG